MLFARFCRLTMDAPGPIWSTGNKRVPKGDYFVLALDPKNGVHIAWGEGPNYSGPGNVLYVLPDQHARCADGNYI